MLLLLLFGEVPESPLSLGRSSSILITSAYFSYHLAFESNSIPLHNAVIVILPR